MKARVMVRIKKDILDPQGKALEKALDRMSVDGFSDVRVGKLIECDIDAKNEEQARKVIEDMCKKLFINPVMEEFDVEICQ